MRLATLFAPLAFISLVVADGQAIVDAITTIQAATVKLNGTVANFNGNPLDVLPISIQSFQLLGAINDGTKTAEASAPLVPLEALTLALATQSLSADVISSLATIRSKKPVFAKLLLQPVILLNLKQQQDATKKFSSAVIAKLPADLQAAGTQLNAPILAAFDAAITDYETFSFKEKREVAFQA